MRGACSTSSPPARLRLCAALLIAASACGRTSAPPGQPPDPADPLVAAVRDAAVPLTGSAADYDPLLATIGDAQVVLLGEQTHGTREFYRERASERQSHYFPARLGAQFDALVFLKTTRAVKPLR